MGSNPCNIICQNKTCGYTCIGILFLVGLGLIIQVFFVQTAVEDAFYNGIDDRIVMTQHGQDTGMQEYKDWINNNNSDAPVQTFEYWVFNVTNPYDVGDGDYPEFDLIGPFTFRRFETKTAPDAPEQEPRFIETDQETTVEYDVIYHFEFVPEWSTDNVTLDDEIFVISGAMQGLFANINLMAGSGPFLLQCVDKALNEWPGEAIFYHTTVRNLTWGVEDQFIQSLDKMCENETWWALLKPSTLYSLIADGRNRVLQHTGLANRTKVSELEQFRNFTVPPSNRLEPGFVWDHNESVVGARETRNFPPRNWINKERELIVWSLEKFRKTTYLYDRDVVYKGVDLMRFRVSDAEGLNCENNAENCKFYQFWENGIWNLTSLRGSPSFISKGRFLDAPFFMNDTNEAFGLSQPTYEEDDQYFDVDPLSGIVFRNWHNYQINFRLVPMDRPYETNFTNYSVYDRLLPMAYVRVEALATDSQMDFYKSSLRTIDVVNGFSLYGGPAFAVVCFGFMFWILCKMKRKGQGYLESGDGDGQYGRLVENNNGTGDVPMNTTEVSQTVSHTSGGAAANYGAMEK